MIAQGLLVFWRQQSLVGDAFFLWTMHSKWPTPFRTPRFPPISAHSASTVTASEINRSISTNRKSTTRFPTSHRRTMYVTPKSPKCVTKSDFPVLPVKFNCCWKKSAAKFLCVKTPRGKVVATSFVYLTVHRCIVGDVLIYLKFALKVTHPFRKRRFWQILLNTCNASAMRASKKVQLSLIESRQCAFHRAINEPCALPLSHPYGYSGS